MMSLSDFSRCMILKLTIITVGFALKRPLKSPRQSMGRQSINPETFNLPPIQGKKIFFPPSKKNSAIRKKRPSSLMKPPVLSNFDIETLLSSRKTEETLFELSQTIKDDDLSLLIEEHVSTLLCWFMSDIKHRTNFSGKKIETISLFLNSDLKLSPHSIFTLMTMALYKKCKWREKILNYAIEKTIKISQDQVNEVFEFVEKEDQVYEKLCEYIKTIKLKIPYT